MRTQLILAVLFIMALLMSTSAEATTITNYGSDVNDTAAEWRTGTTAKTLDCDGDDIYGSDGWAMWLYLSLPEYPSTTKRRDSFPDYVDTFAEAIGSARRNSTFARIDDPRSGQEGSTIISSIRYSGHGTDITRDQISFTVDNEVPASFVFGFMTDNFPMQTGKIWPVSFNLVSSSGASSVISLLSDATNPNLTPDFYFFKVDGATSGETFTLQSNASVPADTFVGISALTWDTVSVPEPSTIVLLLGGLGLLLFRRVKR